MTKFHSTLENHSAKLFSQIVIASLVIKKSLRKLTHYKITTEIQSAAKFCNSPRNKLCRVLTKVLCIISGYRKCPSTPFTERHNDLTTPPSAYRNDPATPSPPPLPPRGRNVGPPVPPSSSTKNETKTAVEEFPKGQQINVKVRVLKLIG